jgi:hypothetical protein
MSQLSAQKDLRYFGRLRIWLANYGFNNSKRRVIGLQKGSFYVFTPLITGVSRLARALESQDDCELDTGLAHRLRLTTHPDGVIIKTYGQYYQFYVNLSKPIARTVGRYLAELIEDSEWIQEHVLLASAFAPKIPARSWAAPLTYRRGGPRSRPLNQGLMLRRVNSE